MLSLLKRFHYRRQASPDNDVAALLEVYGAGIIPASEPANEVYAIGIDDDRFSLWTLKLHIAVHSFS
ncbi:hypothetical protein ASE69_11155 [Sphingomonas sp. Leaf208]|nr:hypothetical protein ASE69_11155 [Sphingomonas sp. Leaf208]